MADAIREVGHKNALNMDVFRGGPGEGVQGCFQGGQGWPRDAQEPPGGQMPFEKL